MEYLLSPSSLYIAAIAMGVFLLIYYVRKAIKFFADVKRLGHPLLKFGKIRVIQPNNLGRVGSVSLLLKNVHGGKAVVDSVVLKVVAHGAMTKPARIRKATLLPDCVYKALLRSDRKTYMLDLDTQRTMVFRKMKSHDFSIKLASDEHHWYRMLLEVAWHSKRSPKKKYVLRSNQFYIEFPVV